MCCLFRVKIVSKDYMCEMECKNSKSVILPVQHCPKTKEPQVLFQGELPAFAKIVRMSPTNYLIPSCVRLLKYNR